MYQPQFARVQIGTYVLPEPRVFPMPQEVAAWHAELQGQPGEYPIYGKLLLQQETPEIEDASIAFTVPGVITSSAYPSLCGGVPYSSNENTDVGRQASVTIQPYAHSLARMFLAGESGNYRLDPKFQAVWQPYNYTTAEGKVISGCSAGIVLNGPVAEVLHAVVHP